MTITHSRERVFETSSVIDAVERLELQAAGGMSSTLSSEWYTSEELFVLERELVLRRMWHPVAHVDQLEAHGDYITLELLGEPLVVVRDKEGTVRAFSNVCRHRGAPVALGCGNRRAFQCPYHGWVYNLDGSLRNAAGMDGVDLDGVRLPRHSAAIWGKWVFVSLAPDSPPIEEWLAPVVARSENYAFDQLRYCGARRWSLAINWKNFQDNYLDVYHIPFIHPALTRGFIDLDDMSEDNPEATEVMNDWGPQFYISEPNPRGPFSRVMSALGGTQDFRVIKPPLPSLQANERNGYHLIASYPSVNWQFMPDGLAVMIVRPISAERTDVLMEWWMPEAESVTERVLQAALILFGHQILDEDAAITTLVQGGLNSALYTAGPLSPTEERSVSRFQQFHRQQVVNAWEHRQREKSAVSS